jgi:4-diphosphocytidyl-2-C-methyl-D-erythritol kinase
MVNVSVDLCDVVTIEPADRLELRVLDGEGRPLSSLPLDERNIAWRAAEAAARAGGVEPRWRITIEKRIPIGAGLAGGSTDAAGVLRLLGREIPDLDRIALSLGADVPYCLDGRPALVEGIGERITPFALATPLDLLLVNPGFEVSTRSVFEAHGGRGLVAAGAAARLVDALEIGDRIGIGRRLANDLQAVTAGLHPEVPALCDRLTAAGAEAVLMSGSGPTVFGLFASSASAEAAADGFAADGIFACPVRTISGADLSRSNC